MAAAMACAELTGAVLHQHLLLPGLAQLLRDLARRQVGPAAGSEAHQDADGPARIIGVGVGLRLRLARCQQQQERKRADHSSRPSLRSREYGPPVMRTSSQEIGWAQL